MGLPCTVPLHYDRGGATELANYVLLTAFNHCCPADEIEIEQEAGPSLKPEVSWSALLPAAALGDLKALMWQLDGPWTTDSCLHLQSGSGSTGVAIWQAFACPKGQCLPKGSRHAAAKHAHWPCTATAGDGGGPT